MNGGIGMTNTEQNLQTQTTQRAQILERPERPDVVFTPATDVIETQNYFQLDVDMPGVDDKGIDLTLENDVLTIRGRVANDNDQSTFKTAYKEYETGDYHRVFTLTQEVDRNRIEATIKDGVLHLVLPKSESVKPRKIEVHAA
jgi:HSP20 family protein